MCVCVRVRVRVRVHVRVRVCVCLCTCVCVEELCGLVAKVLNMPTEGLLIQAPPATSGEK